MRRLARRTRYGWLREHLEVHTERWLRYQMYRKRRRYRHLIPAAR